MKAIVLLILTNLGVMIVLAAIVHLFGLDRSLQGYGMNNAGFLLTAMIYGFAGSFISLLMSKSLAKRQMRVRVIDRPQTETEQWLVATVAKQAQAAGFAMPEVGIFDNPAPNAFATGHSKNASLVAVSTGLLQIMSRQEAEAVLGHEISHIKNGDMVASTLIQGTINTFVIVFARIIAAAVSQGRDGRSSSGAYFMVYMLLQTVLGFLGSMVVFWHSRHREFAADRGGAQLAGKTAMIGALRRLQMAQNAGAEHALNPDFRAFGIVRMNGLFATHPPLEKRIQALQLLS